MKTLRLDGKTAAVIGGTSGIGLALVHGLAESGADVAPISRRTDMVEAAARIVEGYGRKALRLPADVADRKGLETARDEMLRAWGKVDVLVNCAGITKRTPTIDVSEEEWNAIIGTNLTGAFRVSQVFGRPMLDRGYGKIVHIASLSSFVGLYEVAAYTASKAGVAGLVRALAVDWAPRGLNVNAIAPGVFKTALNTHLLEGTERGREYIVRTPMKRFGQVSDLAGACVFLASDAASFVNGEILTVDGGFLASGVNQ